MNTATITVTAMRDALRLASRRPHFVWAAMATYTTNDRPCAAQIEWDYEPTDYPSAAACADRGLLLNVAAATYAHKGSDEVYKTWRTTLRQLLGEGERFVPAATRQPQQPHEQTVWAMAA